LRVAYTRTRLPFAAVLVTGQSVVAMVTISEIVTPSTVVELVVNDWATVVTTTA